jgi:uncharacterized membrane protein YkoI
MPSSPGFRVAIAAACCALVAASASSERSEDAERARKGVRDGSFVSLTSILEKVEARYFGHAIEVELDTEGNAPTYEIEWLTPQGHVIEFEFDARNGALLETEGTGLDQARRP